MFNLPGVRKKIPELKNLWALNRGEITAVVGAGGKTGTMNLLAREFNYSGVVYTTTTAVLLPDDIPHRLEIVESLEDLQSSLRNYRNAVQSDQRSRRILVVGQKLQAAPPGSARPEKVLGLESSWLSSLAGELQDLKVLVEADGAASHRIKAPAEHEPVIPRLSDNLLVVQGASALGRKLKSPHCFRADLVKNNQQISRRSKSLQPVRRRVSLKLYHQLFAGRPGYGGFLANYSSSQLILSQCPDYFYKICRRLNRELKQDLADIAEGFTALNYERSLSIVYQERY